MQKVWFITGAAKGIGNAVANEVLKAGGYVVATTRKENDFVIPQKYSENVLALKLDVSNSDEEIYNIGRQILSKMPSAMNRRAILSNWLNYFLK